MSDGPRGGRVTDLTPGPFPLREGEEPATYGRR